MDSFLGIFYQRDEIISRFFKGVSEREKTLEVGNNNG
jgi:hypothetical protein